MTLPLLEPLETPFSVEEFGSKTQLLEQLGLGNEPVAVMLTCWELFLPEQVSMANPGEILVVQNPGGLVPDPSAEDQGAAMTSIVHAVTLAGVRHLIVCGHTVCKTIDLLLRDEAHCTSPIRTPLDRVDERYETLYGGRPARDRLGIIIQESVLQQLARLRSHPGIEAGLREGSLLMHGWVRNDETSTVTAYDPGAGQFCA